jgi:tetratricopeptide (TPR) repeat protein
MADVNRAIELEPGQAIHWVSRGLIQETLQEYQKAIADHTQAIQLSKGTVSASVWHRRAATYIQLRQWDLALSDCNSGLKVDPRNSTLLLARAGCRVAMGQYAPAADDFRAAYESAPTSGETHNALARFLASCPDKTLRDPRRAIELASNLVKLDPRQRTYLNTLAIAQYHAGDSKAAVEALQKSMEFGQGGDALDYFYLAMAHWCLDQKEQARKWYDQAVAWMDKNPSAPDEFRRAQVEAEELLGIKKPKP